MVEQSQRPTVSLSLHGPGVTIGDAAQVGVAGKELMDAIAQEMGVDAHFEITAIQFRCDGCGLTRPDRPGPDEGWSYVDGEDHCPVCTSEVGSKET
jgi:hypothetical protein